MIDWIYGGDIELVRLGKPPSITEGPLPAALKM